MNCLWWSRESQSVGVEVSVAWFVGGGAGDGATNEELEHALVLNLTAIVGSLKTILLRDGV